MNTGAKFSADALALRGALVFEGLDRRLSLLSDATLETSERANLEARASSAHTKTDPSPGCFLKAQFEAPTRRAILKLGRPVATARFVCCHRYDPYWMRPKTGVLPAELPTGTLYALFERDDGSVLLVVPLVDEPFSCCLRGSAEGVELIVDSGDTTASSEQAIVAYVAIGSDPYALVRRGACAIAEQLGSRLRADKPTPSFVDRFGWCTWDAFYRDVTPEKVPEGLQSFRAGGVEPRFMILDDGWQSVDAPTHEGLLTSFTANDVFQRDLSTTVKLAKERFNVEHFLVWHAVYGYWSGMHPDTMRDYAPEEVLRWYCPEVLAHAPDMNCEYGGPLTFRPAAEMLPAFYDAYHASLKRQGVDGVKVDNQASVEGLAHGRGGRVTQMKAMRAALEHSVGHHFDGNLINCMSCAAEMFYLAEASTVTRTSTDFWPQRPETHGLHLYTNAFVSLWFGEFILPDWDMFQSTHAAGAFHAAARAISGGPVYVSDKPGEHDFALLRRLVLSDGSVPRALDVARPTWDCLFVDPTTNPSLLKLYNTNATSYVVVAFNAFHDPSPANRIVGSVGPADIPQLRDKPGSYALYFVESGHFATLESDERVSFTLANLEFEVVVIAPIRNGAAALGLIDKLNPGGAVVAIEQTARHLSAHFEDGGRAMFYCRDRPCAVRVDGELVKTFEYRSETGALIVELLSAGAQQLTLELPG